MRPEIPATAKCTFTSIILAVAGNSGRIPKVLAYFPNPGQSRPVEVTSTAGNSGHSQILAAIVRPEFSGGTIHPIHPIHLRALIMVRTSLISRHPIYISHSGSFGAAGISGHSQILVQLVRPEILLYNQHSSAYINALSFSSTMIPGTKLYLQ